MPAAAKTKTPTATANTSARRQFMPRPPKSKEERLPKLYQGLTEQVDGGHFQNAIKTCRKNVANDPASKAGFFEIKRDPNANGAVLTLDPASVPAFQTLLFLHLHTDDYSAALTLLENPPSGSAESLRFERAYSLYRLHRERDALDVLQEIPSHGRKEEHLGAQIRYRLGDYERAQAVYDSLLSGVNSSSSEYPDIMTNLSATAAHVDFLSHGFHSHLSSPSTAQAAGPASHVPTEADLETYVPSLPTGWATGGVASSSKKVVPPKQATAIAPSAKKPRHKLPKGAVPGKPFVEDPDRWLPMKQRATFISAQSKKKGGNMSMGVGITQGSTSHPAGGGGPGAGGGGGNKKKKGKK